MRASKSVTFPAALLLGAAAIACAPSASAAPSSTAHSAQPAHAAPQLNQPYWETATGYGATLTDAKDDAEAILNDGCVYGTNGIPHLVSSGQLADGSWYANMKAYCSFE